jgi:hypothetical protein
MSDITNRFYDCLKTELANAITAGHVTASTVQHENAYDISSGTLASVDNSEAITISAPHGANGPISISSSSHVTNLHGAGNSTIIFTDHFDGTTSTTESGDGEFAGVAASTAATEHVSARKAVDACKAPIISSLRSRSSTPSS